MQRSILLLTLLVSALLHGAPSASAQQPFDLKPIGLMDGLHKGKGMVGVGQSRAEAIKVLGQPTRREKVLDEATGEYIEVLYYRTNVVYFENGKLDGFDLNDNTLKLGNNAEQAYGVGSKLTVVLKRSGALAAPADTTYLLDSRTLTNLKFAAKLGRSHNINYQMAAWNYTRFGDIRLDGQFEMLFDKNNQIISINTGSFNH